MGDRVRAGRSAPRRFATLVALVAVAALLLAWGSRDVLFTGNVHYQRMRCCQRLRICALELKERAAQGQPVPATLSDWAAQDPYIATVFRGDLDSYELLPPSREIQDKFAAAGRSWSRDAAGESTLLLVERKQTHDGMRHALFADFHLGAAPER